MQLARTLHSFAWVGRVAVTFNDLWMNQHQPNMVATSASLRAAASTLRTQAQQQRGASASGSGSASGGWLAASAAGGALSFGTIAAGLAVSLADMRGRSPAEQLAWWNSLTSEQQRALLRARPGELTGLTGLPSDVRHEAQDRYTSSIAAQIKTGSVSTSVEASGSVKVVKISSEYAAEVTTYRDGHVEVDLSAVLKGSGSAEVADLAASQGVAGVYSFENQAEADAFLRDLKKEIVPSGREILKYGTAAPLASVIGYLASQSDHLKSVTLSQGGSASVQAQGSGSANVSANVSESVGRNGDVTLKASEQIAGQTNATFFGVKGSAEVSAALTMDGADPKTLTFTESFKGATLVGVFSPVADLSSGAVASGTATISFDLTDPAVAAAANSAADAMARGDVAGAAAAMGGVIDRAQIVVQQEVGATSSGGFDATVVSGRVTTETSTVTSTYIKPPGGTFYEVK